MPFRLAAALLFLLGLPAFLSAAPQRKTSRPKPRAKAPAAAASLTAEQWMRRLTPRQRIAQLLVIKSTGEMPAPRTRAYRDFVHLIRTDGVGGVIVNNRVGPAGAIRVQPAALAAFVNRLQRLAPQPLLIGGDFERGPSMRVEGTPAYPHAMAFAAAGDPGATRALGLATAREARALGVHWVFAPDADVNNNPLNPIINIRSFGEDPALVARHVSAFIAGAHSDAAHPVLVTVKHFPGHGDTATDSHLGLPTLPVDRARLDRIELVPFRAAIAAGVDSVMTAHITVPALDPANVPSTVSRPILTGLLREELGFEGLITTDAMDMAGLSALYPAGEAAVRALEAGADVLLIPADPRAALTGILAAVREGRLTQKRLDQSVRKVLEAKLRLGLHKRRLVDPKGLPAVLDAPASLALAQSVADRAVTLLRDPGRLLPLTPQSRACVFLLPERAGNTQGEAFTAALAARAPQLPIVRVDPSAPDAAATATAAAEPCERLVVAAFTQFGAYKEQPLPGPYPELVTALLGTGKPVALLSLGSPYLITHYPAAAAYLTTYSTVPPSETAAVKALFGEIPAAGQQVVTLPR